jgi:hypothetical protein
MGAYKSAPEARPPDPLVLRFVRQGLHGHWHIAFARQSLAEGALVKLECLCGEWAFGFLTRDGNVTFRRNHPGAVVCMPCADRSAEAGVTAYE